jgi:hypothetical protein
MDTLFQVHMLNEQGKNSAKAIANAFDGLLTFLEGECGAGRELSIVKTKLEEACFFAKKAMANKSENQEA